MESNNVAINTLMKELKERKIEKTDVQTNDMTLSPVYNRPRDGRGNEKNPDDPIPKIIGYEVGNQVVITVRDVAKLGVLLDVIVGSRRERNRKPRVSDQRSQASSPRPPQKGPRRSPRKGGGDGQGRRNDARDAHPYRCRRRQLEDRQRRMGMAGMGGGIGRSSEVPIAAGMKELTVEVRVSYELKPAK